MTISCGAVRAPTQDFISVLTNIADWRDALRKRISDALNDSDPPDLNALRREVLHFRTACRALMARR